jgi:hypothetical protein
VKRRLQLTIFTLRQLGLLGWVGVVLLCGSASYFLVIVPQHDSESDALRREIAQLRQNRSVLLQAKTAIAKNEIKSPLQLPTVAMTPEILLTLEELVHQDGLQLKRNDYRYVDTTPMTAVKGKLSSAGKLPAGESLSTNARLLEVRIVAPASGSYKNVRTFLSHALEKLPSLALDDMSLKREAIGSSDLQAQLRFTLFVRDGT